ncbi:PAS domain S-box protein [Phreatobacter aquaticus]|uniref:PAS domain S-box protein n=1 Tax=Phreatobacter aquaticus TaxID=2570229 RepID=A0A4D7QR97_9HYPH|nr:PAS domain-containing methyl-accepting chemotaxis protein [Phreatobacter aquaticus]QCK86612.1 PAS domain S-box protein [Phreatobacter aquaticus]
MGIFGRSAKQTELEAEVSAIRRSQAVIEFNLDGTITSANAIFLEAMGYAGDDIVGMHHRIFVDAAERETPDYREFWKAMARGEFQGGEYRRIAKDGHDVWIQATYTPIVDSSGRPTKVVKYASDITRAKMHLANIEGQIAAFNRSQAVIEFSLDGTIIDANDNFTDVIGYSLAEIQGKHHRMFVDPTDRDSAAYREFWARLARGEFQAAEYRRIGKGGREIWILASYNPILDPKGKPFKVVKLASNITEQVMRRKKTEFVSSIVTQVAAGAEELEASIRDISQNMLRSKDAADTAVNSVDAADSQTARLTAAAASMTGILDMINNITGQINLLALNATIEAARAGEAGRGFAVVANEVKGLAAQARHASDQIASEIESMRGISSDVLMGLETIKASIDSVRSFVNSTASAVEEQSAVTGEMASTIQRAAVEAMALQAAA